MHSVYVYPSSGPAAAVCRAVLAARVDTWCQVDEPRADLAIAPLLQRVLTPAEAAVPRLGTLILHPSLLPRRRGPDAVRWTVLEGDAFTGVTWFWCADGLDTGDICEQELVSVPVGASPRELYERSLVPAAGLALGRALDQITRGYVRRVSQDPDAATYQSWHPSRPRRVTAGELTAARS